MGIYHWKISLKNDGVFQHESRISALREKLDKCCVCFLLFSVGTIYPSLVKSVFWCYHRISMVYFSTDQVKIISRSCLKVLWGCLFKLRNTVNFFLALTHKRFYLNTQKGKYLHFYSFFSDVNYFLIDILEQFLPNSVNTVETRHANVCKIIFQLLKFPLSCIAY